MKNLVIALTLAMACMASHAGEVFKISTRPDVDTKVFWHETPNAKITVLMFSGGGGGFGAIKNGLPTGQNFLIRTAPTWIQEGPFNYAAFGKPSDMPELDYPDRISSEHLEDIKKTIAWLKSRTNTPIWLVGTSRGTISAAHALIHIQDPQIAGGVFTSSVTAYKKPGAVPRQDLEKIRVPVLVLHHEDDACNICKPHEAGAIVDGLTNSPTKKLIMVAGGDRPQSGPCEALHYHGFIGIERDTIQTISKWIRQPGH